MNQVEPLGESRSPRPSGERSLSVRVAAVVAVAAACFGLGLLVGRDLAEDPVGRSPAIDIAMELGFALPVEQQPAFADGVITEDEVRQAADRFEACVETEQVAGFEFEFRGRDGFGMSYNDHDDYDAVQACETRHFEASYNVWRWQDLNS